MQKVVLLEPIVTVVKLQKSNLPEKYQSFAQAYNLFWHVTVTPLKTKESRICQVAVLAAANDRTGSLKIENLGRVPKIPAPLANQEDMRPAEFLVFGTGSQKFKVMVRDQTDTFKEVLINFN